jgi:hypothetical protein
LAGRLGALRARIAAQRPVPDDLPLLSVPNVMWLEALFCELEAQRYNITLRDHRPVVIVTTTGEESAA